jgi:hypothetical protein
VFPSGVWSDQGQSRVNRITLPAMTRTHHRLFPLKTKAKKCTPQNSDPELLQEWELVLTKEEDIDFVFPLEPEDLGQYYSPDVLEFLG